jgi:hypothetical protein
MKKAKVKSRKAGKPSTDIYYGLVIYASDRSADLSQDYLSEGAGRLRPTGQAQQRFDKRYLSESDMDRIRAMH